MASIYRMLALRPLPLLRVAAPPRTPVKAFPVRLLSAAAAAASSSQTSPSLAVAAATTTPRATDPETPPTTSAAQPTADDQAPDAPRKKSRRRATKVHIHPPSTKVKQRGPYFVARNFANNLAVYQRRKRGGNMLVTEIKKVQGDARKLVDEIRDELELSFDDVKVNPRTNHVVLKGHLLHKVKTWLVDKGF